MITKEQQKVSDKIKFKDGADQLKQGWEMKKLGEVVEIINGKNQREVLSEKGSYPIYGSAGNLMGFATDFICEKGTTIIGRKGNISNPIYINERFWNVDTAFGIYPMNGFDPKFINYLCQTIDFRSRNRGTTIPSLVKTDLLNIEIYFNASLPEQKRIVTILDECFAAIDKAKANAEQNLRNARDIFEGYLQRLISSDNEWNKKTLTEISTTFGRGKSKHRPRNWEGLYGGNYPFIQTGDIRNCNHYITEFSQTYNDVGLAQSKLWPVGTICITIAANIAETGILSFEACFPDSVIGIVVNEKIADRDFVEYLLQAFKARIQSLGKGSAQANINMGTFENETFPFPPVEKQREFVKILNRLALETHKLEEVYIRKLRDFEELKKSILQKAFVGGLKTEEVLVI